MKETKNLSIFFLILILLAGCGEISSEEKENLKQEIKNELEKEAENEQKKKFENDCKDKLETLKEDLENNRRASSLDPLDRIQRIEIADSILNESIKECGTFYNSNENMTEIISEIQIMKEAEKEEAFKLEKKKAQDCLESLEELSNEIEVIDSKSEIDNFNSEFSKVQRECLNEVETSKEEILNLFSEIDELRDLKANSLEDN